ncbi:L-seryl-tRNA(Sec) selenium transferase [Chloroflexota bacterium]
MMDSEFRQLPSVDRVLSDGRLTQLEKTYPHELLRDIARREIEDIRRSIAAGNPCPTLDEIVASIGARLYSLKNPSLRPVVNASGVILHTNLGRARLSREAIAAMNAVAGSYCNLEFDLDSGVRGSRNAHVEPLLCQLTGAEAALVVNNNASGVLLALTALARRKEVIVSRSQAVEIGGGFRIPAVMRQSGAKLVEVGTTNCTYINDYEQAISPRTAALLRVHSSNFRVVGFTHSVDLDELVALGNRHSLPVFDDVGSGCFLDTAQFGLAPEPMVTQSVALGAGLVLFSGDKLLGGPQAGIIVGREELVGKLRKHPLARGMRIDKVNLAGLLVTLIHYLKGEAMEKIPLWRMISAPLEEINRRAALWAGAANGLAQVMDGETMVGGGSLPGGTLPTKLVAIGGEGKKKKQAVQGLASKLRCGEPPVIGRISGDTLLLDPRSVLPEEDDVILRALKSLTV